MVQLMLSTMLVLLLFGSVNAEEAPTGEVVVVAAEVEETRAQKVAKMFEPDEVTTPTADPVICSEVSSDIGNWEKVKDYAYVTGLKIKVFFVGEDQ